MSKFILIECLDGEAIIKEEDITQLTVEDNGGGAKKRYYVYTTNARYQVTERTYTPLKEYLVLGMHKE